jgi:undecaprenyl-diphosphatase
VPGLPPLTGTPTGLSFPSAHATSSFAGARAYSALVPGAPLYALATALALSRLYLGVHWPSDSLAGAVLGILVGSARR